MCRETAGEGGRYRIYLELVMGVMAPERMCSSVTVRAAICNAFQAYLSFAERKYGAKYLYINVSVLYMLSYDGQK